MTRITNKQLLFLYINIWLPTINIYRINTQNTNLLI